MHGIIVAAGAAAGAASPLPERTVMSHVFTPPASASVPDRRRRRRDLPVHRIYCVGRNYVEHAKEMGFTGREPPFFFMKPADAVLPVAEGEIGRMPYPSLDQGPAPRDRAGGRDRQGRQERSPPPTRCGHVWGYAVGLDMTRRDLQGEAKKLGRPWDIGKSFDHSAPIGPIRRAAECRIDADTRDHARGQRQGAPAEHDRQADLEHRPRSSSTCRRPGSCSRAT